jgi:site-specific DNA recombinase
LLLASYWKSVVARFSDAAVSGGTSSRPGYQALLCAARRREVDVIVAEDSSRLWRELAEQWRALKELQDLGVHVVGHGLDTRREESKILLAVSGAMAEAYRDEIARRTRRGLEGRAIAGKPTGGRAYGYIAARDCASGQLEIDANEAAIVRRIFELYADGTCPRSIAATLNAESTPSPGARWNRTVRRRDRKWLASAIHGDVNRGTGILNNRLYIGVVLWGRSEWKRSAADSSKRRHRMLATGSTNETTAERLRIVPQELWERVKARQAQRSHSIGALVRGGLRRRAPGAGRPAKHLFSGLRSCGVCEASFVLRNRTAYACASYWNGAACSNSINVSRSVVQDVMLTGMREDLTDPAVIDEVERRFFAAMRRREQPSVAIDHGRSIAQLLMEIDNLIQAIATGALRGSPAIGQRLQAAEAELARLQAAQKPAKRPALMVPNVRGRFLGKVGRLDTVLLQDPERGRDELRGILGERIKLQPDESGRFTLG